MESLFFCKFVGTEKEWDGSPWKRDTKRGAMRVGREQEARFRGRAKGSSCCCCLAALLPTMGVKGLSVSVHFHFQVTAKCLVGPATGNQPLEIG